MPPIEGVPTATAGFAAAGDAGPDTPELIASAAELERLSGPGSTAFRRMVLGFFDNGGKRAYVAKWLEALESVDEVALLCPLPSESDVAIAQCERRRDRVAILSLPAGLGTDDAIAALPSATSAFAAAHYPWVRAHGEPTPPGGHVAGVYAASEAPLTPPSAREMSGLCDPPLERALSRLDVEALVEGCVNPIRVLPGRGVRVWASRTLEPGAELHSLVVRRLLIFLQTSIERGLRWAVVEPNGEQLWATIRKTVTVFLADQWRAGSLQGHSPPQAFFVRCDRTTMTQNDLDNGRLVCEIGVAVVRPAEFVIFRIGQWTADHAP
jgi:phage tail sheath protein FI